MQRSSLRALRPAKLAQLRARLASFLPLVVRFGAERHAAPRRVRRGAIAAQ